MSWSGLPERIESKLIPEPNSGCWLWLASVKDKKNDYGNVGWQGRVWSAHRLVYTLLRGAISKGLSLDHLCRTTICCNPDHLEPVTWKTNIHRGIGIAARNRVKTHCARGHEFTIANTYIWKSQRFCRACHVYYNVLRKRKKRDAFQ